MDLETAANCNFSFEAFREQQFLIHAERKWAPCGTLWLLLGRNSFVHARVARSMISANQRYHRNVYVSILLNQWLAITMLQATDPWQDVSMVSHFFAQVLVGISNCETAKEGKSRRLGC